MVTVFTAIIVLGILILIHELGHFIACKLLRVGVEKFSIGFGPRLIGRKKGETEYLISAIPLGGYIKMIGENPGEECDKPEFSFSNKPIKDKAIIVAAGPMANFVLAIIIFALIYMVGMPVMTARIGGLRDGYPAKEVGLRVGDKVIAVDGKEVNKWDELSAIIHKNPGKSLLLTVERESQKMQIAIVPKSESMKNIFNEEITIGLIGITPSTETIYERNNPGKALYLGTLRTYQSTKIIIISLVKLIQGNIPAKSIGGPILIAQMAGEQAKQGVISLLFFMSIVSINLAILNLFPIPILDGGHLLFFVIEAILGKPIGTRKKEIAQQIGLFILILLMVFAFYNDIFRIIKGQ